MFCLVPQLVDAWPAQSYLTQTLGTMGWERYLHGKGFFLFSYLEMHPTRNCGFYTEPGVYQIVLNSTLYILLFWKEKLMISSEKKYRKILLVIIAAIIACQSTTGYLALLLIILFFCFYKQRGFAFWQQVKHCVRNTCVRK